MIKDTTVIRDVRNRFFISVSVWFFEKTLDSVRNEFCSVRLKNAVRFGYYSYLLLT